MGTELKARRGFLGAVVGAIASLLGVSAPSKAAVDETNPGRVFRMVKATQSDGRVKYDWKEITPEEVRAGDWIVRVGLDGKALWRVDLFRSSNNWEPCPDGTPHGQNTPMVGTYRDVLNQMIEAAKPCTCGDCAVCGKCYQGQPHSVSEAASA